MSAPEYVRREPEYSVYALALEDDCYYVGKAKYEQKRIRAHFRGKGAEWTKVHEPVEVDFVEDVGSNEEAKEREREVVEKYIEQYGKESVRGAGHTGVGD
jgi:predicted GIY-YIG superfamily endonuclease